MKQNIKKTYDDKTPTIKKYNKPNVICNSNQFVFYKYYNIKIFDNLSFKSKYSFLVIQNS